MNAPWQYLDPPAPDAGPLHGRDEVLAAERWAWAGNGRGRRAAFFFDGFDFWRQLRSGERQAIPAVDAPARGWWHKPACNCPLCAARLSTARPREQAGRGRL